MAQPPLSPLDAVLEQARACTACADLPLGPRPVLAAHPDARVVVIGQAPGTKVHASGIPWDDASGDHLREWLDVDKATFYDPAVVAILPMGLCYPGRRRGGDAPPRAICAPLWHDRVLAHVNPDATLILVGQYAQKHYLGSTRKKTLTETVRHWRTYAPAALVTPHPSWRSRGWMKKNPWFADEVLPALRRAVRGAPVLGGA